MQRLLVREVQVAYRVAERRACLNKRLPVAGETPPEAVIHGHFNGVEPFI